VSLTRTTCPSCGAALKSAAGFKPGQSVRCPKCSTAFAVEEPAFEEVEDDAPPPPKAKPAPARAARARDDDEDDDRPRKKRRPRDDDDDDDRPRKKKKAAGGYKNSPLRYAILGVLLVVLGVMAFLLWQKKQREAADDAAAANAARDADAPPPAPRPMPGPDGGDPAAGRGGFRRGGGEVIDPADNLPPRGDPGRAPKGVDENVREAAANLKAINDGKQLALAVVNYHDVYGALPAPAIRGPDGKALLSWRVAILPFIEQEALHKRFKLTEPWDSPANKALIPLMPKTFQGTLPAADGKTAFKVFAGPGTAFDLQRKMSFRTITDGTSNTIGVIEAGDPVEWTRPADIPFDGKTPPRITSPSGRDFVVVGTLDGFVRRVSLSRNTPDTFFKAATAAGGEVVTLE
jgi:uncharacterized Zn finger protein (UPF0148 family)